MSIAQRLNSTPVLAIIALAALITAGGIATQFQANTGHSTYDTRYTGGAEAQAASDISFSLGASGDSTTSDGRKEITTARVRLRVPDVAGTQDAISVRARDSGGYITDTSIDRGTQVSGEMTVRVPEANLSRFLEGVSSRWQVEHRRVSVQDVTDRHTELTLELKNRRQELQRLESLLNQTDEVSELVQIEERRSEVRSRIQYLEQELEQLDTKISYATVHISLTGPTSIDSGLELSDAVSRAGSGVFKSIEFMIVGVGYLAPVAAVLALLYSIVRAVRRMRGQQE